MSKPAAAPPKPAIPPATEVEIQRRFNDLKSEVLDKSDKDASVLNELRREMLDVRQKVEVVPSKLERIFMDDRAEFLDTRANIVDWWLAATAIFLTLLRYCRCYWSVS